YLLRIADELIEAFRGSIIRLALERAFPEARFYGVHEIGIIKGLGEVIIRAEVHSFTYVCLFCFCGEEDEWYACRFRFLAKNVENTEAVQFRHHYIADDEVGVFLLGKFNTYFSVFGGDHIVVSKGENLTGVFPYFGVVFYKQYLLFHTSASIR